MALNLKNVLSKIGNNLKKAVQTVANTAKKIIPTIQEKSSAIVQTVASVATGNVAGVVAGVANIFSPSNKTTSAATTLPTVEVVEVKKSTWKERYNNFTKGL